MTKTSLTESMPPPKTTGFQTGLHYHTGSTTLWTRLAGHLVRLFLRVAARFKFLGRINLERITTNSTDLILNLPGTLPFFPTKVTEIDRVRNLIRSLSPVSIDQELLRLGPNGDGGYMVPNDLNGIEACFSPGVGNVSGFEMDCARLGMKVFMADGSVDGSREAHDRFHFLKKFVGATTEGDFISLADWVATSLPDSKSDLLLQIDIEGYEYETILSAPSSLLQRFRIIVVEFHNLDCLFSEPIFALYAPAFSKLLSTHTCVHAHVNDRCSSTKVQGLEVFQLLEITFLRNDRVIGRRPEAASYR